MEPTLSADNPPTFIETVAGTLGFDEDPYKFQWYEKGSAFEVSQRANGLIWHPDQFIWDTDLDGVSGDSRTWKAAGLHAKCHFEKLHLFDRNIIAHSHGGNVMFFAAFYGLKIRNLITVGTPVRKEIEQLLPTAVGNIGHWLHLYDSKFDWWSLFGGVGDGRFNWRMKRSFDMADQNVDVRGAGHTGVLENPEYFPLWASQGWAQVLKTHREL